MGGEIFSTVHSGRGTHLAFYTLGTVSLPGVKQPGRGVNYPPLLVSWTWKSRAIPLLPHLGINGLFYGELGRYIP